MAKDSTGIRSQFESHLRIGIFIPFVLLGCGRIDITSQSEASLCTAPLPTPTPVPTPVPTPSPTPAPTPTPTPTSFSSNMFRDSSVTPISLYDEAVVQAATVYPLSDPGYRAIPKITKDDDGNSGGSVTHVDRSTWGTNTCGLAGTIEQRIADCAANVTIGPQATWDGAVKSNNGSGIWKLVSRTGAVSAGRGREVWRDERTKLVWSSAVSSGLNWCKASGSNFITGNPSAEDDPSNLCDSVTYQTITPGLAISACYEDGEIQFTSIDAAIDPAGKAGLGFSSTPRVAWRLPTLADYQQANVNGLRFVIAETANINEWTATIRTANRAQAHSFDPIAGGGGVPGRINANQVRCVGR